MKLLKWILIIGLSVGMGMLISRIFATGEIHRDPCRDEHGEHDEHGEGKGRLELSRKSQELIDLKTTEAKLEPFVKKIAVVGQIAQDGESASHITCDETGVISELKVSIGSAVQKDAVLCTVKVNGGTLREIKSPVSGVVIGEFVKKGDRVDSISSIYTIADLSKLYGTFDIYEKDISAVKTGQKLLVRCIAYPDKVFDGEIIFVSPRVDEDTHTIKVRGVIQNPEYLLKFGMFVNAELLVVSEGRYIVVPQETVHIISGKRAVFIKTGDEKIEVRQVIIKDETSESAAIAEGIKEGEAVVVQDGFLLKSELLKSQMGEGCAE